MKNLLFLSLIILSNYLLKAQSKIDIEYGAIFKNEKREIPVDIIGQDENGYYLLYSEGKYGQGDDMFLRKFNLDLTPSNKEINLKNESYEGKFNSLGLTKLKTKIVHVFYLLTEEGKNYYYQNIDLSTFSLSPKKLITTVLNDSKNAKNSLSRFLISDDENTITLFYTIPNKNKETAKIRIQTFDSDFNEKTSNYYDFPYNNDVLSYRSIFMNSKNELFILCKKYNSYKTFNDENNHRYEFQLYQIKSNQLGLLTTIKPENVHLRSLNTSLINDEELVLTGLYSEKDLYAMNGVYASKINLTNGEILSSNYNKFSSDFFSKLMEDGKKKNKAIAKYNDGKRADQNYILKQTIKLDNDEILVLAEQVWSYSYNYAITYYHHDIAAIKLDSNGSIIWANKIGKRNDKPNVFIYNSYHPVYKNDKLYLLYNCSAKNLNHSKGRLANYFTDFDRAFIATNVDLKTGNYKRQILIKNDNLEGITIRPSLYNWVNDDTLLMFGQDIDNLKNQRFVKLKFN
ncbi:hypothetical protein [uncultured Algibacter sp.]|uniref:hypothetical protein n=1 Tax=uncultured Algibacter sp. TaxID=298659 RepID=UPI002627784F|nr:hypothetical protein [uncultured Algibacter sp.]